MKKFRISSTFFAMLAVALIAFGCNENEDPITPDGDAPNNPTALQATSGATGAVMLKWVAPVATSSATLDSYELTYTPGGTTPVTVAKGATTYTVTGLTVGTVYQFTLKSKGTNSKVSSGTSISWAAARRSGVVRLYGSASSQGSGLDLDGGTGGAPQVLTVANGNQWDITFDDKNSATPLIGSPGQSLYVNDQFQFPNGQTAKQTLVSNDRVLGITSLDQVFESAALSAGIEEKMQRLDNINETFAFVVKTDEGNYAKILVIANGGQVVQGSGSDKFVEVMVSYQPSVNVPYALPGNNQPATSNNTVKLRANRSVSIK